GYQNVSYFIRSFKKMYGVSPLKYRNFQTLP
ncbi:MAG: helix-turn-helix domain-containing protein, partial [Agathobacter rectalis]